MNRLLIMRLDLLRSLVLRSVFASVYFNCLVEHMSVPVFLTIVHLRLMSKLLGLLIIKVIAFGVNNTVLPLSSVTSKVDIPIGLWLLLLMTIAISIAILLAISPAISIVIAVALAVAVVISIAIAVAISWDVAVIIPPGLLAASVSIISAIVSSLVGPLIVISVCCTIVVPIAFVGLAFFLLVELVKLINQFCSTPNISYFKRIQSTSDTDVITI